MIEVKRGQYVVEARSGTAGFGASYGTVHIFRAETEMALREDMTTTVGVFADLDAANAEFNRLIQQDEQFRARQ